MKHDGAAVGAQLLRHCLRVGLLLGGSVVLWWAFATGTAQADDQGSAPSLLDQVGEPASGAGGGVAEQVRHTARTATEEVRRTASRTDATLRATGRSAPSPVRAVTEPVTDAVGATLQRTARTVGRAEATIDGTVARVADTVDQQVSRTTQQLDDVVRPVLAAPTDADSPLPHAVQRLRPAPSATGSARILAPHSLLAEHRTAADPVPAFSTSSAAAVAASSGPASSTAQASVPQDPSWPGPSSPDPAFPTSSVTPSPSVLGMLGALVLAVPLLLRLRLRSAPFALSPAPALLPGCSPD